MIALILIIIVWGTVNSVFLQHALQTTLTQEGLDKSVIEKIARSFTLISTGLTIVGAVIFLFVSLFFAKMIAQPIKELTEGAIKIAHGQLDVRINVISQDEVGQLAATFNQMVEDLQRTTVSKKYVDSIIGSMIDTLVVATPQATIKTVNQAALDLLGYTEDELINKPISTILADGDLFAMPEPDADSQKGDSNRAEKSYLSKDGRKIPVLFSKSFMYHADGRMKGIVCVAQDITERLRAEEALRHSEAHFRSLIENGTDIITILNRDGKILYESPSIQRIFGYHPEELVEQSVFEMIHSDDVSEVKAAFTHAAQNRGLLPTSIYRFRHKNGTWRVVESRGQNLFEDPAVAGFVVNSRDITEREQANEALEIYAARLKKSNRELEEFAYIASHDLQEPLRKVTAFGSRIQTKYGEALGDRGLDYLGRMLHATERMQTLINGLLDYSRVTSKAKPFEPVDLTQIAGEVVSDLEMRIQEVNGRVEISDLPNIQGDPLQMRQLLQNLIGNALKFNKPNETPVVRVYGQYLNGEAEQLNGQGHESQMYQINVTDNGIGFDEKYVERIFGVFQRLHGRSEYEGTGIGLAICKKIAERHGGSIHAHSIPDQGATFTVILPITQFRDKESA